MTYDPDDVFALIGELRRKREAFCLATVVRTEAATSAKAGAKAVVTGDGVIHGHLGGSCVTGAISHTALEVLASGTPRLIRVRPRDQVVLPVDVDGVELHKSSCPSGGTVDLFIEPMLVAPHLVVCGASPVGVALADLGKRLGYRVTAAALEADLGHFGGVDDRIAGFDLAGAGIGPGAFVVVATQGRRDREALTAALAVGAAYVGFVGSRRKAAAEKAALTQTGMAAEALAAIAAPAGLDIHAIEPAEIALSILSQIVQRRRASVRQPARAASAR